MKAGKITNTNTHWRKEIELLFLVYAILSICYQLKISYEFVNIVCQWR